MGRKIFVSYKYADTKVQDLRGYKDSARWFTMKLKTKTTVRHYVDELTSILEKENHIYKGEDDGEDLSSLHDSTIASKLGDKIFDSTITVVLISKGMKTNAPEKEQWIPWEISYSLKEQSRQGQNSKTNAVLAVVIPAENGKYDYFIEENTCSHCNALILKTNILFKILSDNMFDIKKPNYSDCPYHGENEIYTGYSSFIETVKWHDFISDPNYYLNTALEIRAKMNEYNIVKNVK